MRKAIKKIESKYVKVKNYLMITFHIFFSESTRKIYRRKLIAAMREESTNGGSEEHHSGNGTTENGHDVSTEQVSNHRYSFLMTRMVHTKSMLGLVVLFPAEFKPWAE